DVADLQGRVEAAGSTRADHGPHRPALIDQVLRLHGVLGLAVSADRHEHAEFLEMLTLLAADLDARPGVTGHGKGAGDALQLDGLGHRDECLGATHTGLYRQALVAGRALVAIHVADAFPRL